jgi:hypothetical protein
MTAARAAKAAYMREWRARNRERAREISRTSSAKYRMANLEKSNAAVAKTTYGNYAYIASLKANPCMDCGGTFPSECMDFDHVRGEKVKGIGAMRGCSRQTIDAEVAKCDLVCANCHRTRTRYRKGRMYMDTSIVGSGENE